MKAVVALICVMFVAAVMAEDCPNNDPNRDCHHITCDTGYQKECHNRVCTCSANTGCVAASDCSGRCDRQWHCVDGHCRCFGGF